MNSARRRCSRDSGEGTFMILSISYKLEEWRNPVEKETDRRIGKLKKLLKHYKPDLVQLHGSINKHARKPVYMFTLNLALPTGTVHAAGEGADVRAGVKAAFSQLEAQVKKHVALLRKDYEWKRKRPRGRPSAGASRAV